MDKLIANLSAYPAYYAHMGVRSLRPWSSTNKANRVPFAGVSCSSPRGDGHANAPTGMSR